MSPPTWLNELVTIVLVVGLFYLVINGAILWLAGRAPGLPEGVSTARALLASGAAHARLGLWQNAQQGAAALQ